MLPLFRCFLPWIFFTVLYRINPQWYLMSSSIAVAMTLVFEHRTLKQKRLLPLVTLTFFVAMFILAAIFNSGWLLQYADGLAYLALTVMAIGSLIINIPFLIQYTCALVPPWQQKHPTFIQINKILTAFWAGLFALAAVASFFYANHPWMDLAGYLVVINCLWIIGAGFSGWFSQWWRNYKYFQAAPKNKADSPFLKGNFAPWRSEDSIENLEIVGQLPPEINGVLLRNGPNPQFDPLGHYHWFEGDGMIHGIYFENGKATYRNRWVRTERFKIENAAGKSIFNAGFDMGPPPKYENTSMNTANTNITFYNDKLLALNEGSPTVEMKVATLETLGDFTFDERITKSFTAHPRYDYHTKELLTYGYINYDDTLRYYRINESNRVVAENTINWPYPAMIHDFVITEHYVIFPIFPVTMNFQRMFEGGDLFVWEGDRLKTYFIVCDRDGVEIQRFEADPCFSFHFGNAFESGTTIIIDAIRDKTCSLMPDRQGKTEALGKSDAHLVRWTLDLEQKTIAYKSLDTMTSEFPRFDMRFNGRSYKNLFTCGHIGDDDLFDRIIHYHLNDGTKTEHLFENAVPGEPVFVPRSDQEGDGYLLTVVYRNAEDRSDVVILDAQHIDAKPVAIVKIPHRIPYGFHGNFINLG